MKHSYSLVAANGALCFRLTPKYACISKYPVNLEKIGFFQAFSCGIRKILVGERLIAFTNENLSDITTENQHDVYYTLIRLYGLGYKSWNIENKYLVLDVGYGHYLCFSLQDIPLSIIIRKNKIFLYSTQKVILNNFANSLMSLKTPNPYNLKGIRIAKKNIFKKNKKKERLR